MQINKFLEKGYYGFYDELFIRTIYIFDKASKETHNLLTIIKLQNKIDGIKREKLLKFDGLRNRNDKLKFGLLSYQKPIEWLEHFKNKLSNETFCYDDESAKLQEVLLLKEKFFVSERTDENLSNLLLHHSHHCSYIDEYWNIEKKSLFNLHKNISILKHIEDKTGVYISKTPERVGNVIIQYTSGLIDLKDYDKESRNIKLKLHPSINIQNTKCIFISKDKTNNNIEITDLKNGTDIVFTNKLTLQEVKLIDIEKNLILFDYSNRKNFKLNMSSAVGLGFRNFNDESDPILICKTFSHQDEDSTSKINRLIKSSRRSIEVDDNIKKLKYKEYDIDSSLSKIQRRDNAIYHLNQHIKEYGDMCKEVIIWDPYLEGKDLVDTVIRHLRTNAKIKALGSFKSDQSDVESWFNMQKHTIFESSDLKHLNLEFRCAFGNNNHKNFHDRFILFKGFGIGDETKGWALGTSLNSLGHNHHIIYELDIAEYVLEVFEKYWETFSSEKYVIVKTIDGIV